MSRAYRIKVSESLKKVIRAEDHVRSQLEVLQVLPAGEMAELIAQQLIERGFERDGNIVRRTEDNITVSIDLTDGSIEVRAEASDEIRLQGERSGRAYDDAGPSREETEKVLREELSKELEDDAKSHEAALQRSVTDALEGALGDVRQELDRAVNQATAEALKQKAARIGSIKRMDEDPETGSLTIVVEV